MSFFQAIFRNNVGDRYLFWWSRLLLLFAVVGLVWISADAALQLLS